MGFSQAQCRKNGLGPMDLLGLLDLALGTAFTAVYFGGWPAAAAAVATLALIVASVALFLRTDAQDDVPAHHPGLGVTPLPP